MNEKTTYCRPVRNLNTHLIHCMMERNDKLKSLVKKITEAREKEKEFEAWNKYLNELKAKNDEAARTHNLYRTADYDRAQLIYDCYNMRVERKHHCQSSELVRDIYGVQCRKPYTSEHHTIPKPNRYCTTCTYRKKWAKDYRQIYNNEPYHSYPISSSGRLQLLQKQWASNAPRGHYQSTDYTCDHGTRKVKLVDATTQKPIKYNKIMNRSLFIPFISNTSVQTSLMKIQNNNDSANCKSKERNVVNVTKSENDSNTLLKENKCKKFQENGNKNNGKGEIRQNDNTTKEYISKSSSKNGVRGNTVVPKDGKSKENYEENVLIRSGDNLYKKKEQHKNTQEVDSLKESRKPTENIRVNSQKTTGSPKKDSNRISEIKELSTNNLNIKIDPNSKLQKSDNLFENQIATEIIRLNSQRDIIEFSKDRSEEMPKTMSDIDGFSTVNGTNSEVDVEKNVIEFDGVSNNISTMNETNQTYRRTASKSCLNNIETKLDMLLNTVNCLLSSLQICNGSRNSPKSRKLSIRKSTDVAFNLQRNNENNANNTDFTKTTCKNIEDRIRCCRHRTMNKGKDESTQQSTLTTTTSNQQWKCCRYSGNNNADNNHTNEIENYYKQVDKNTEKYDTTKKEKLNKNEGKDDKSKNENVNNDLKINNTIKEQINKRLGNGSDKIDKSKSRESFGIKKSHNYVQNSNNNISKEDFEQNFPDKNDVAQNNYENDQSDNAEQNHLTDDQQDKSIQTQETPQERLNRVSMDIAKLHQRMETKEKSTNVDNKLDLLVKTTDSLSDLEKTEPVQGDDNRPQRCYGPPQSCYRPPNCGGSRPPPCYKSSPPTCYEPPRPCYGPPQTIYVPSPVYSNGLRVQTSYQLPCSESLPQPSCSGSTCTRINSDNNYGAIFIKRCLDRFSPDESNLEGHVIPPPPSNCNLSTCAHRNPVAIPNSDVGNRHNNATDANNGMVVSETNINNISNAYSVSNAPIGNNTNSDYNKINFYNANHAKDANNANNMIISNNANAVNVSNGNNTYNVNTDYDGNNTNILYNPDNTNNARSSNNANNASSANNANYNTNYILNANQVRTINNENNTNDTNDSDRLVCIVTNSSANVYSLVPQRFELFEQVSRIDKMLIEELNKMKPVKKLIQDIIKRDNYSPCGVQISMDLPTRDTSVTVTGPLYNNQVNAVEDTIRPVVGRDLTMAVNTDPVSLQGLLRISSDTIRSLLVGMHFNYMSLLEFASGFADLGDGRAIADEVSQYVCCLCEATFGKSTELGDHILAHGPISVRTCCTCRHLMTRQDRLASSFTCRHCHACFARAYSWQLHEAACPWRRGSMHQHDEELLYLT